MILCLCSVGAALLNSDGMIIGGCNVENASHGKYSYLHVIRDRPSSQKLSFPFSSFSQKLDNASIGAGICAERTAITKAIVRQP